MTQPIFSLNNTSYSYSENNYSLSNIDLDIFSGERVAILGANGSGKSTLLKLLDGLIFSNGNGIFSAFNQQITEEILDKGKFASFFRSKIAFVFQDSDIQLFSATVFEDLMFGPLQLGLNKEEAAARAEDLLDMLEIKKLKNRSPNNLSGGEKKKVAIATSLSTNPDVLLLDEPTNNLDPKTKSWLYQLLNDLSASGKTIILATQDLELARVFAQRTIVLNETHKIAADGITKEILNNKDLLLNVNLIHEHFHFHKEISHNHPHSHSDQHEHEHKEEPGSN
jgi:cobalt/nickel transport system ATP-binding protein